MLQHRFLGILAILCCGWPQPAVMGQEVGVHDPCLIKQGDTYVLFSTGGKLPIRRSLDLVTWERGGDVLAEIPAWAREIVPETKGCWAPDIAFFDGEYHLYYSVSTFGKNLSCIGLTTNVTLDPADPRYAWKDQGEVIRSRPNIDDFNAIDPNVVLDAQGQPWMSLGSFWNGLYLTRLDLITGKPVGPLTHIAGRHRGAIEAPFIVRHETYYYLFVSFDVCCKGVDSTYKIMVGRSARVDGPYVDSQGQPLVEGGGTLVLAGHDSIRGPGHNAVLADTGRDWLVHHAYDTTRRGRPILQVRPLLWSDDGWPLAGEPDVSLPQPTPADLTGTWDCWIDYVPQEALILATDGTITKRKEATWRVTGSRIELTFPTPTSVTHTTSCHIGPQGQWFVGRDSQGRIWRGIRRP